MKIFDVNNNGKVEFWELLVVACVGYTVIDLIGVIYRFFI